MRVAEQPEARRQGSQVLKDGRYEGGNEEVYIELRIDGAGAGAISADLYRRGPEKADYVASIRSAPGEPLSLGEGAITVIGEDELGGAATGKLSLTADGDRAARGQLLLDGPLNGLPRNEQIGFEAEWSAAAMRSVGIEIETEEGVDAPAPVEFQGRPVSLESCLTEAGFEVGEVGAPSRIPSNPRGWGISELHTLMQDFAAASLEERTWALR